MFVSICGVRAELGAPHDYEWPQLENDDAIMTVGASRPLEDATRIAPTELVHWIHRDTACRSWMRTNWVESREAASERDGRSELCSSGVDREEVSAEQEVIHGACVRASPEQWLRGYTKSGCD